MSLGRRIKAGAAYVELSVSDGKLVNGLKSAQRHLRNFGQAATALGGSMLALSGAAAAPFIGAVRVMTSFSDQMAQVRSITGASTDDFGRLESKAKELGSTTSFSARQVAEAMQYLGMAGFDTNQILAGIPDVLNLARAGAIGLGEAADIASDVGSAFGLSADQIGRVADVMAKTASSANTSISMMGETMKYAAPLAAAAGQSIEDTATAIGVLGNSGIKASSAGTDLAKILKNMGNAARKNLKRVGVDSVDAAGNIRSVVDVMGELGRATAGMSGADRLKFFEENFDRAAKSALILADAGGGMTDLQKKIDGAGGSAKSMAGIMEDTVGGSFRTFMSAVEGAAIAIGEALAPQLRAWAEQLGEVVKWVQMAAAKNSGLIVTIAKTIAVVAAVGAGLLLLGTVATVLGSIFGVVAGVLTAVGTVLGTIGTLISALFTPIGATIAVVVALGAAFLYFSGIAGKVLDWVQGKFGELAAEAGLVFDGIRDALASGNFELAAKILWLGLKLQWQKGVAWLKQLWADFGTKFMAIATTAFYGVAALLNDAFSSLEVAWLETTNFFSTAWSKFTSFVLRSWNTVSGLVQKAWAKVKGVVGGTDSAVEIKRIENETRNANLKIQAETEATLRQREQNRKFKRQQIEQVRQGANRELFGEADRRNAERDRKAQQAVKDAEASVEKARADLAASIAETKDESALGGDAGPETDAGKIPRIEDLQNAAAGGLKQAEEKAGANVAARLGTDEGAQAIFEALRGGGPSPEMETAKNTGKIADGVKRMQKEQEETNRKLDRGKVIVKRA